MATATHGKLDGRHDGKHIGLIGLGLVGAAIAQRLAGAGYSLIGHDRDAARRAALLPFGGEFLDSPRAVAERCERIVLAVYDTAGVENVLEGSEGALAAARPLRCVIDTSTGDPERLEALGRRLGARGVALIEAPLAGSSAQIAAGEATMILGGDAAGLREADDLLLAIAAKRHVAGAAGMGARAKLAVNLVLGLNRAALAEGLAFAETQGLDVEKFLALLLDSPARSAAIDAKGAMMISGRFTPPQSRIAQHRKDLALMLAEAAKRGGRLPLTEAHAAVLDAAIAAGEGDLDNAAVIRPMRRLAMGGGGRS